MWQNSNFDVTQNGTKLKMWPNSKTKIVTKLKKIQIVTKLKKTQIVTKYELWQISINDKRYFKW